jgi:uncharacterized protein YjbJ (UPF0337 family)
MGERLDELKGSLKAGLGKATGDEGLETEGQTQRSAARGSRKVKGGLQEAAGRAQEALGTLTGNAEAEAEGAARRAGGKLRRSG